MSTRELARIEMPARGRWLVVYLTEHQDGGAHIFLGREVSAPTKAKPDRLSPTPEACRCDVRRLPALRAALELAESEALAAGLLGVEDYAAAGLAPPLREVA